MGFLGLGDPQKREAATLSLGTSESQAHQRALKLAVTTPEVYLAHLYSVVNT